MTNVNVTDEEMALFEDLSEENVRAEAVAAVYIQGYRNGWRQGQNVGLDYGSSLITKWQWLPIILSGLGCGTIFGALVARLIQ